MHDAVPAGARLTWSCACLCQHIQLLIIYAPRDSQLAACMSFDWYNQHEVPKMTRKQLHSLAEGDTETLRNTTQNTTLYGELLLCYNITHTLITTDTWFRRPCAEHLAPMSLCPTNELYTNSHFDTCTSAALSTKISHWIFYASDRIRQ